MNPTQKLAEKYTNRFFQDNKPNINQVRQSSFNHKNSDGSEIRFMNGEFAFGPSQTWPAQVDDFFNKVLMGYNTDKIDYENVSRAMEENSPGISTRDYISEAECNKTLNTMFEATISAMSTGKKWQYIKDIGEEEAKKQGFLEKTFREKNGLIKRLKTNEDVQRVVENHNKPFSEYSVRRINIDTDLKYIFA